MTIDSDAVRAAIIRHGQVLMVAAEPLPPGACVRGTIVDERRVGEALRTLWREHDIGSTEIHVNLVSERTDLRRQLLPKPAADDDLQALIAYNHEAPVPDAVLSYAQLGEVDSLDIALAAAPAGIVAQAQRVARLANLVPRAISLLASTVPQSIVMPRMREAYTGILHVGWDHSVFIVCTRRIPVSQLVLAGGWGDMLERVRVEVPTATWADLRAVGYADEPADERLGLEHYQRLQPHLLLATDVLMHNLSESVDLAQARGQRVDRVFLTGRYADTLGLNIALTQAVGTTVELPPPRDGLEAEARYCEYAPTLGACYQPLMSLSEEVVDASMTVAASDVQADLERRSGGSMLSPDRVFDAAMRVTHSRPWLPPILAVLLAGAIWFAGGSARSANDALRTEIDSVDTQLKGLPARPQVVTGPPGTSELVTAAANAPSWEAINQRLPQLQLLSRDVLALTGDGRSLAFTVKGNAEDVTEDAVLAGAPVSAIDERTSKVTLGPPPSEGPDAKAAP